MRQERLASKPNSIADKLKRPWLYRSLAVIGLSAVFGILKSGDTASASSPSTRQKVAHTAESFAAQAIRDFRTASRQHKQSASGMHNVEAFLVSYPAKDLISKKPAEYIIEASITKDSHGALRPKNLNNIIIREQAGSDQVYELQIGRTENNRQWDVNLAISNPSTQCCDNSPFDYSYSTGRTNPQESVFPLTTQAFTPIAQQGQTVLNNARNRSPITQPTIPFPPPHYVPQH